MAIEVQIIETINEENEHTAALLDWLTDGWEIMAHQVILYDHDNGDVLYTTLLKRDDDVHTRTSVSSVIEQQRKNTEQIKDLSKRVDQLLSLLDSSDSDEYIPVGYVPLSQIDIATTRDEIVEAAIREDLEAER